MFDIWVIIYFFEDFIGQKEFINYDSIIKVVLDSCCNLHKWICIYRSLLQ